MRTLLVTGGCGFIGSHFIRRVLQRPSYRVVNVDKLTYAGDPSRLAGIAEDAPYRFVRGDIADGSLVQEVLAAERPWAIVNFAAESHVDRSILDPAPFLRTNVLGVQVLLEAARRSGVERFMQVSTDEVYGDAEGLAPRSEDDPLAPSSPYSASKAAADLLCLAYQRTYGLAVLIVRSSNNYGPFQHPEKLIPLVINAALAGGEIPVYGDGGQQRDWLYVEDNCRALSTVLERGQPGAIYNVATGVTRTNVDVIRQICAVLADELRTDANLYLSQIRSVRDRPGHDRVYAVATDRVSRELGWTAEVDFAEGLRRTVRWYLANREWLKRVTDESYRTFHEAVYVREWNSP
ncbi:MAG TPA: dTDP-glucose 4,6-dehydratase [Alphaproteobacteria bacterium]|nr:dTDP-glucose 4,6-dehydratase [Alphaproteobacteria bacterium]